MSDYTMVPRGQVKAGDLIPIVVIESPGGSSQLRVATDDDLITDALWRRVDRVDIEIMINGDWVYLGGALAIPVRRPANTPAEERTGTSDTTHAIRDEIARLRGLIIRYGDACADNELRVLSASIQAMHESLKLIEKLAGGESS